MKYILVFCSDSEKRLLLLHAQIDDKCSDSSHSPLKSHCFTKWIENYDAVVVSRSSIWRLLVLLINRQNQEMEKFLEGLCVI